jgi:hypothetical protein
VNFVQRTLTKQDEFINDPDLSKYDVVFNCLGLGAGKFCDDPLIKPARGHMIRVFVFEF